MRELGNIQTRSSSYKRVLSLSHEQHVTLIERESSKLSATQQAELLGVSRSTLYYQPREPSREEGANKHHIDELYTQYPFYSSRRSKAPLRCSARMPWACHF